MSKKVTLYVLISIILLGGIIGFNVLKSEPENKTQQLGVQTEKQSQSNLPDKQMNLNEKQKASSLMSLGKQKSNVPTDPRLNDLIVSEDNALIEYIHNPDGQVIKEIDNNSVSASFKKPLKIYQYKNGKVSSLVRYQYNEKQVLVSSIDVAYNEDGSIKDYRESTTTQSSGY